MEIRKQFNKLYRHFSEQGKGTKVNFEQMMADTMEFFEQVQLELQEGSPEEKKELLEMMEKMYQKLNEESERISEEAGMSEEELMAYSENPDNFTPMQWMLLEHTKKSMKKSGRQITRLLSGEKKAPSTKAAPKKKGKRAKKSTWMRS